MSGLGHLFVLVSAFLLALGFYYNDRIDMLIAWGFLAVAVETLRT